MCVCGATQQCLISVILGGVVVTQQIPDLAQSDLRVGSGVGETCKGRRAKTESARVSEVCASWLELGGVFTVGGDDDDVLSLIEVILGALCLKQADHLVNTMQRGVQVGPRFPPVACR